MTITDKSNNQEDSQKLFVSIIKKGVNKFIKDNNLQGDFYIKRSYKHSDSNTPFYAYLAIGIEFANNIDLYYEKEYTEYLAQDDILIDALVHIASSYILKSNFKVIQKVN